MEWKPDLLRVLQMERGLLKRQIANLHPIYVITREKYKEQLKVVEAQMREIDPKSLPPFRRACLICESNKNRGIVTSDGMSTLSIE